MKKDDKEEVKALPSLHKLDLYVHTVYSDGKGTIEEVLKSLR